MSAWAKVGRAGGRLRGEREGPPPVPVVARVRLGGAPPGRSRGGRDLGSEVRREGEAGPEGGSLLSPSCKGGSFHIGSGGTPRRLEVAQRGGRAGTVGIHNSEVTSPAVMVFLDLICKDSWVWAGCADHAARGDNDGRLPHSRVDLCSRPISEERKFGVGRRCRAQVEGLCCPYTRSWQQGGEQWEGVLSFLVALRALGCRLWHGRRCQCGAQKADVSTRPTEVQFPW